ncbi:MAG TPA: glycoside hydrolase family 3 protein [Steroidobacteraceae bacterium]
MRTIRLGRRVVGFCGPLLSGTIVPLLAGLAAPASAANWTVPSGAEVHPAEWPSVPRAIPEDPALEARIDRLLRSLTPEQKVGQLIQADIARITPDDLRHFPLGSVLNGGNSSPGNNVFAPPSEWLALADRFYESSMDPSHGPHAIPTLWAIDAVHGIAKVIGATVFPHNIGLGAARDPALVREIGAATALEVRTVGLDWTYAPTLAVARDDRWGRTYESYSEDPHLVRQYAREAVLGLQGAPGTPQFLDSVHILATAKHFVGGGGTGGRDEGDNRDSESELREVHFAGFPEAVSAGVQAVMTSLSSWQGVRMAANRGLITDVLKARLHFDGLVIGDWNAHGQIRGCSNWSCATAINAGLDVLMAPDSWKDLFANTLSQVHSGQIPPARLDDAVRRILRVKLRARLFEEGRPSSRPMAGRFDLLGSDAHRALARRAVRESLVLLKNTRQLLPLSPHQHVLVAGDAADNIAKQSGGWTLRWQGTGLTNKAFPHCESIYAGIRSAVTEGGGTVQLSPSGSYSSRPDVAIVVFGENPYAEVRGDLSTVEYSPGDKRDLRLLRTLRLQHVPVVSVFVSGRPLWVTPELDASDAFVAAWLPGGEGEGIADLLFKAPDGTVRFDFRGKLSFSWPRTPQQVGVYRGDNGAKPLFPYGYGLTYSEDGDSTVRTR